MKYLVLMLLFPSLSFGQIVDGKNLADDMDIDYLDIYTQPKGVSDKVFIAIEYGQEVGTYDSPPRVMDSNGKPMVFNSLIDALNKFSKWGWELNTIYTSNNSGKHAVLKRKAK